MSKQSGQSKPAGLQDMNVKASDFRPIGDNLAVAVVGDTMLIAVIDTGADLGESSSGKTHIVASTRGNQAVSTKHGIVKAGVNLYKS